MSFFFGKKTKTKPTYTGLQLQTSSSVQAIPILWGGNRVGPNIFWYGDFKAIKKKQKAGKGMGGSSTYYEYSASFQGGLCEGPIFGVGLVFKEENVKTTLSALGMSLFTGTYPQTPWGYLTTKHPLNALAYEGVAYVAIANYNLGQSASLGNHSFETFGVAYNTAPGGHDADCAFIVKDFLTSPQYGAGFGLSRLDEDQLFSTADAGTTGDSSYQTYCTAMGFGLSPVLSDPTDAGDTLARWATLTNSAIVWNGYKLKLIPYVRDIVVGNGVTYLPPQISAPAYTLTDDDFLDDLTADRIDQSDCPNVVVLEITNRFNEYNDLPVEYRDQALIDQFGERKGNSIAASEVTDPDMAAEMASLICARSAYIRNQFNFTLGQEYILLEPMDTLIVVNANGLQILVQIISIQEGEDFELSVEAEEIANNVSARSGFTNPGTATPVIINSGVLASPVNTPIIFEPSASVTNGVAQVWAAVSGGNDITADPNWGGAEVYISLDNITYQAVGTVDSAARQGKLTAIMPDYMGSNPDMVSHSLVDLRMSAGELQSVNSDEASRGATLCIVGDELFSFQTAALTDTNRYDLAVLYRGLGETTVDPHAAGTRFARLDDNIFKYDLPVDYIGKLLYLKFQSFNIWNGGLQDLEDVIPYTYNPTGKGFRIGPPASIALVFSASVQTDGTNIIRGTVNLGASPGPFLDHYDVEISSDDGATYQAISNISASGLKTFFEPAIASTNYKARARAVSSAVGGIPSDWVTTATVNSGTLGGSTAPNSPTLLTATPAPLANKIAWVPPASGAYVQGYHIWGINDLSGIFTSAVKVGTVSGSTVTSWNHTALPGDDDWRYWVTAFNLAGDSAPVGPQNSTTLDVTGGGGSIAVQQDGVEVVDPATILNFTGDGVAVSEGVDGVAIIDITRGPVYGPGPFPMFVGVPPVVAYFDDGSPATMEFV